MFYHYRKNSRTIKLPSRILILFFFKSFALYSQCEYHPLESEGYMQVWNIEHHSSRFFLNLTYMISNLGKGFLTMD